MNELVLRLLLLYFDFTFTTRLTGGGDVLALHLRRGMEGSGIADD